MMQNYPTYQPYNAPYQQYQPPYQPPISSGIQSKMVDDFGCIGVNDVSMDGNASVFLKKDLSEIQIRKWGADGRIYSTTYKPCTDTSPSVSPEETRFDGLNERLQIIEDKIDRLIKPTAKKVNTDANS